MIFFAKENKKQIITFSPPEARGAHEWFIISSKLPMRGEEAAQEFLRRAFAEFQDVRGFSCIENDGRALSVVKLGDFENYSEIKQKIEKNIEGFQCKIIRREKYPSKLKQLHIQFFEKEVNVQGEELFKARESRPENIVMIVDDELMARESMKTALKEFATIVEMESAQGLADKYKEVNPDVVFLDIHMPGPSGIEAVAEISDIDLNAFIVMSSADSVQENVLDSIGRGAVGFTTKPIQKDKLVEYMRQCVTYWRREKIARYHEEKAQALKSEEAEKERSEKLAKYSSDIGGQAEQKTGEET